MSFGMLNLFRDVQFSDFFADLVHPPPPNLYWIHKYVGDVSKTKKRLGLVNPKNAWV